ncbi:MAG: peptidoglycan DD-metalloendopeptidase family protein [candidate division Zixibacteria bacterium]|nr:peptidoglycan DD-metalloendopeptidase family protein [candidate division Zixibacteria bacterium]
MLSRRIPFIIFFALLGFSLSIPAKEKDLRNQQSDLEKIKADVNKSQKKLDSLKNAQKNVQKKVAEFDQKITSDRKVIDRLSGELSTLRREATQTDSALNTRKGMLERSQRRYLGNIRQFYVMSRFPQPAMHAKPSLMLNKTRQITYLKALAGFEGRAIDVTEEIVSETESYKGELSQKTAAVSKLKRQRETSFSLGESQKQKKERELERLRKTQMNESDRLITLTQAAEEMESIISRLEAERKKKESNPSIFASLQGNLQSPFPGTVVVPFGPSQDKTTKLRSFSPGITIQGKPSSPVMSVADGSVAYSGNLRGYGIFVIINHDDQYYTTYAGLGEALVAKDQIVRARMVVGKSASDGLVKFELRKGRDALDPVTWILIESF